MRDSIRLHGLAPIVWLDGQGLKNGMIEKLMTKISEEQVQRHISEWAKTMKIFVSHMTTHQRVNLREEVCNNQVDGRTHFAATS